jgi:hypothetical protein
VFEASSSLFSVRDINKNVLEGLPGSCGDMETLAGAKGLSDCQAFHDPDRYKVTFTKDVQLAYIVTYEHYSLLKAKFNHVLRSQLY